MDNYQKHNNRFSFQKENKKLRNKNKILIKAILYL